MLEIKNLSVTVKDESGAELNILRDVSLTIEDNKFAVVTGPNGGGKTTLAKTIMGLIKPASGSIIWNGTDITDMSITERARLGVSYGFQQPARFKGITVRDLLEISAGETLSQDMCCRFLTQVGLCANDYVDREIDAGLSGGEVKRIEIASILAKNSELMIFDEPEAGIDLWSFSKLTETFRDIHSNSGSTLLVISHQERIISLADEIILISGGSVKKHGPRAEVLPHIMQEVADSCVYI